MNERMHRLLDAALEAGRRMQAAVDAGDAERLARHLQERALVLDALRRLPPPDPADPALAPYRAAFEAQDGPLGDTLQAWEARLAEENADALAGVQRLRDAQRRYDAPPPRAGILHAGLRG